MPVSLTTRDSGLADLHSATGIWYLYTMRFYPRGVLTYSGLLTKAEIAFVAFTLYTNLLSSRTSTSYVHALFIFRPHTVH